MFKSPDMFIGQIYRRHTHIKRFLKAVKDPQTAQAEKLLSYIRANEKTAFGKAHNFDKIHSVSDYQRYVPPAKYENLEPYIDSLRNGGTNQLTAENPFMFATTSGTTAQPKFIPITASHIRDYTHAFHVHNYHLIQDYPRAADGRFLIITSNDEEGRTSANIPYGAVSGMLNRRQPKVIRKHFAIPYELCKIKNVDAKYYLMLRSALAMDVTAVVCCNPSSLLLLADQMKEHAESLVADIFDGAVRNSYKPPAEHADAFKPFFKANKERARQLEKVLESTGTLLPKSAWSNLDVLVSWKGGPMAFYLDKLADSYGNLPVRDFGYMASEGRGSIPISNDGAGGVLALTSHFFEFVEESELDRVNPKFLLAHELVLGGRYYIYFTTAAGLYRYNINDLVEVVDMCEATPVIKFVRKGQGVSSITGEKITEEQVLVAITMAKRQLGLTEVEHCTVEVELSTPPVYAVFAEVRTPIPDSVQKQFTRIFDDSLKNQNVEYQDKRATKRLGEPIMKPLPTGTYMRLRQQRVAQGAPEAQVKIPLLSAYSSFAGQLAQLQKP
ncbi:MAG: GH3 auxin-responsive promoter family protein [Leptolyngbya sp.]|nr:GH3 auxin-responsive promoter family protein [Candidatus Melainabacteria bacterium]